MEPRLRPLLIPIIIINFLSIPGSGYKNTAFNPDYPFTYRVPPVVHHILDHPTLNKSAVSFNSPYANIPRVKIGDYHFHKAVTCGTHFLNPSEGYILSDEMFVKGSGAEYCVWGFVGNQFCTPSMHCPRFSPRISNTSLESDCRKNYLQVTDGNEKFALHFCDEDRKPRNDEYISTGGLLDVTLRYTSPKKRPQFECFVKCIPYKVNFTTSQSSENKTTVEVHPISISIQSNIPKPRISKICRCGVSNEETIKPIFQKEINNTGNREPRILGGREVKVSQYPWMVALAHKDKSLPFCGASLINDRYVLTAQHCLDDEDVDDFEVILNEHDFLNKSETIGKTIKRRVKAFIKYNHYLPSVYDGDMALLALDRPVSILNPKLTPICLPANTSNSYIGYDVIGAGWGTLNETSEKSPKLLEVMLRVMSNAACNDYHSSRPPVPLQVSDKMLCSGYPEGGRDTCSGDSGGPLIGFEDGRFVQIGVTSWGFGCGEPLNPGVFARVTEFMNWIHMNTLDGVYCS